MSRSPSPALAISCARCSCWRARGIDLPLTGIAHSPDDTSDPIAMVGGAPLVVKLVGAPGDRRGAGGDPPGGGERDRRLSRTERLIFWCGNTLPKRKGAISRCLVVGNEVVAAIERRAKRGISALTCTAAAWPRWRRLATRSGPLPSRQRKLSGWTPPVSIFYAPPAGRW